MSLPLQIPSHVRCLVDEDGAVLLDLRSGTYFSLNGVAVDIWQHLEAGLDRNEIERRIVATYDVSADGAREDIDGFVSQLRSSGLLQ